MVRRVAARSLQWFLVLSAALFLVGCGGPGAPDLGKPLNIKGKVTMDSAPAAGVDVSFTRGDAAAPESRQFTARTDANGEYTISNIYAGKYSVMVYDPVEQKKAEEMMSAEDTGKYKNYGVNSTLSADVAEGSIEHNFDLTSQ